MAKRVVKIVLSTALVWAVASMAEHWTAQAFAKQAAVARLSHLPTMTPVRPMTIPAMAPMTVEE